MQAGALYFVPYCNPGSGHGSAPAAKPVTVRSVKRRDRSKSVERRQRQEVSGGDTVKESRPVMV